MICDEHANAIAVVKSEGVFGVETDVIRGSDDETLALSGRILQAGRADVERGCYSIMELYASSDHVSQSY